MSGRSLRRRVATPAPDPAAVAVWTQMVTALKAWDGASAAAVLVEARGADGRTAPGPYWYLASRLADWFRRGYARLGAAPPAGMTARAVCDLGGMLNHLRATAAGDDRPSLASDPCAGPHDTQTLTEAPPPRLRERPPRRNLDALNEALADLGVGSLAELPDALRGMPPVVDLDCAAAWDSLAGDFCRRRDRIRGAGIDPADESPAAWVRRRKVVA